jgi:lysophospholipase L1-like esterase
VLVPPVHLRSTLAKLSFCLAAPVLALAFFELLVKALCTVPPRQSSAPIWTADRDVAMDAGADPHRFHPQWLWEPRPGADFYGERINAGAYRGPEYPARRGAALRIVAIGESTTFGVGLAEAEAWPRLLETSLREHAMPVEVFNFGVIGHSLAHGVAQYEGRVRGLQPDVVIVCYGLNEHWPVPMDDLRKMEWFGNPLVRARTFLDRLACVRWLAGRATGLVSATPERPRVSLAQFGDLLQRLREATRRDGVALVAVVPAIGAAGVALAPQFDDYCAELVRQCAAAAIPCADVRAVVREFEQGLPAAERSTNVPSRLFLDHWHPRREGQQLFARAIERTLAEHGLLAPTRQAGGR